MTIKLKTGREITVIEASLDQRDRLMDCTKVVLDKDGNFKEIKNMHSTITKWLRALVDNCSDKFILELSLEEKIEIFSILQEGVLTGKGKASNSK